MRVALADLAQDVDLDERRVSVSAKEPPGGLIGVRMARSAHNKTTMQQQQRRTASGQAYAGATTDRGRDV